MAFANRHFTSPEASIRSGRVFAGTDDGLALAHDLAHSRDGQKLARSLAGTPEIQQLAQHLATTRAGRNLAQIIVTSEAGQKLAHDLANTPTGQKLAQHFASTPAGLALAQHFASTPPGLALAHNLANTPAGQNLAQQLANTPAGQNLAKALINTKAGQNLARDLIDTDAGENLAKALIRTDAGQNLAKALVRTAGGPSLVQDLASTREGQNLVRDLIETTAVQILARHLTHTNSVGRHLTDWINPDSRMALRRRTPVEPTLVVAAASLATVVSTLAVAPAAAAVWFTAGADRWDPDPENNDEHDNDEVDPGQVWSVADLYDLQRAGRLDTESADRLRGRLEPFLGQVEYFLASDQYPDAETTARVEYEVRQLREELFSENPVEPLGSVVHGYFTSLLQDTLPLLDEGELRAAASRHGINDNDLVALVDAGTNEGTDPSDIGPAVEIANRTKALAPDELTSDRDRTEWAATAVGWATDTALKGAAGIAAGTATTSALNLSWLNPMWAAIIGGVIGIASAIAKIIRTENKDDVS